MKIVANIKTVLLVTVLALSIQSCHIGLGVGIGSSKDKKSSEEKSGIVNKTIETDTTKTIGPAINK